MTTHIKKQLFTLDNQSFQYIRSIVYQHIGVNLTEGKRPLIVSRLSQRLRKLGIDSFAAYCQLLKENPAELDIVANLITTNVTRFFREAHHFDFLKDKVLPEIEKRAVACQRRPQIKVWSAACASGEEPFSIALVLAEFLRNKNDWDFRVLASDVNTQVLQHGQDAAFAGEQIASIPRATLYRYFAQGTGSKRGLYRVKLELRQKVLFRRINLMRSSDYPRVKDLDIIFCRNVFIYFKKENQEEILRRFARLVAPGGYLFLGHAEAIRSDSPALEYWQLVQRTVYQRV